MDMDLDIGWCLTCAKRTRDQRSPYCSETCRQADSHPSTPATEPLVITSPLPPKLIPLPPVSPRDARPYGRLSVSKAPEPITPVSGVTSPTSPSGGQPRPRDRRAFSFPASEEDARPAMPNFNRKPKAVNGTGRSLHRDGGYVSPGMRLSTGANTPVDSALCTSDSEREEQTAPRTPKRPPLSPLASVASLHPAPPLPMTRVHNNNPLPTSNGTSFSSQLHTARPSLEVRPTTTPITRMASSSSRSREDIISWARAVEVRGDTSEVVAHSRRRSRRPEAFAKLTPPSTEPLDEPQTNTPRGAGALNALNMTLNGTFAPVVNALRSVSLVSSPSAEANSPSKAGIRSAAQPAITRVEVIATRTPEDPSVPEAGTPTLSTMSMSEAVDTSNATDLGETNETVTDDLSVASSLYRPTPPVIPSVIHPEPARRESTLPLRPSLQQTAQQTASAIWSFSSYLRSLAPFTTPFSLVMTNSPSTPPQTLSTSPSPTEPEAASSVTAGLGLDFGPASTAALPAAPRAEEPELPDPAQNLVRSVPMDIVIAAGSKAQAITEERAREREVIEYLARSRSRSRGDERRGTHARNSSSDEGRGRRRTRRRDSRGRDEPPSPAEEPAEERGRRRMRGGESRDRSWSACRGRGGGSSRTRTVAVQA